jgi:tetratricopeptide (TPR) repeat protein
MEQLGLSARVKEDVEAAANAVRRNPKDVSKVGDLGMLFYNAACPMAAARCFDYAAGLAPTVMRWRYYLGLSQKAAYNSAEAAVAFESARKLDPKYAPILVELAGSRIKADIPAARELYQKAVDLNPREPRAYYGLGECASLRGDQATAIANYQKALALAPTFAEAHQSLARSLDATGKADDAKRHRTFRGLGGPPPTSGDPLLVELLSRATAGAQLLDLAQVLTDAGKVDQAIVTLQTAVTKDGSDLAARGALGMLLEMTGQADEAVQQFRAILSQRPNESVAVLNLAKALTDARNYDEAEPFYQEVLSAESKNSRACLLYGWHLLRRGRGPDAATFFEKSVRLRPDDPENHIALALGLACLQRHEAAVDQYRRAMMLRTASDDMFPRFMWRLVEVLMEQYRSATEMAQDATTATLPRSLLGLADSLEVKQMPSEAARARNYPELILRHATTAARGGLYGDALEYVRLAMTDEGKKGDATIIGELKKAVAKEPRDVAVHHLLAIALVDTGDVNAAKEQWRTLVETEPKFPLAYIGLALETMREKNFPEARRVLEEGLKHEPESPWLANALAWILATAPDAAVRDGPQAVTWAKKACAATRNKNPVLLDTLAAAHGAAGNFHEAVRTEQEALRQAGEIGQTTSIPVYRERLELYGNNQPYVQK